MLKLAVFFALVAVAFAAPKPGFLQGLPVASSYSTLVKSPVVAAAPVAYASAPVVSAYSAHPAAVAYSAHAAPLTYAAAPVAPFAYAAHAAPIAYYR